MQPAPGSQQPGQHQSQRRHVHPESGPAVGTQSFGTAHG